jgi:hypothetical protein
LTTRNPNNIEQNMTFTYNPTLAHENGFLTLPMKDFSSHYALYEHRLIDKVIYLGICKLTDIYSFPDARQNTEWLRFITGDVPIIVKVLRTAPRAIDLQNERYRLIQALRPPCNVSGNQLHGQHVMIECVEDGQRYPTQLEAAKAYGISQSALSNHLAGRVGYRTLKNHTFKKVANK